MAAVHLPENTILGRIEGVEVYEYLDGPKMFLAESDLGIQYLVYWCGQVELNLMWLYLAITSARLSELKRNDIDYYTAFSKPESDVYLVKTGADGDDAKWVIPSAFGDTLYPPPNYYLEHVDLWD